MYPALMMISGQTGKLSHESPLRLPSAHFLLRRLEEVGMIERGRSKLVDWRFKGMPRLQ